MYVTFGQMLTLGSEIYIQIDTISQQADASLNRKKREKEIH